MSPETKRQRAYLLKVVLILATLAVAGRVLCDPECCSIVALKTLEGLGGGALFTVVSTTEKLLGGGRLPLSRFIRLCRRDLCIGLVAGLLNGLVVALVVILVR